MEVLNPFLEQHLESTLLLLACVEFLLHTITAQCLEELQATLISANNLPQAKSDVKFPHSIDPPMDIIPGARQRLCCDGDDLAHIQVGKYEVLAFKAHGS